MKIHLFFSHFHTSQIVIMFLQRCKEGFHTNPCLLRDMTISDIDIHINTLY